MADGLTEPATRRRNWMPWSNRSATSCSICQAHGDYLKKYCPVRGLIGHDLLIDCGEIGPKCLCCSGLRHGVEGMGCAAIELH